MIVGFLSSRNISKALKLGEIRIEIRGTNLWANRVLGDLQPGVKEKITYTTHALAKAETPYTADSPLFPSGLLGPARILLRIRYYCDFIRGAEVTPIPACASSQEEQFQALKARYSKAQGGAKRNPGMNRAPRPALQGRHNQLSRPFRARFLRTRQPRVPEPASRSLPPWALLPRTFGA